MKILRILTGAHAGIQASLAPGRYRIGKADDTDICITDWDDAEVLVELDEAGVIRARRIDGAASDEGAEPDASVVMIPDFVPFAFGTTVVCFGGDDADWPPDIDLLASMYRGDPGAAAPAGQASTRPAGARRGSRALRTVCIGAMLCALIVLAGSLASSLWQRHAAASAAARAASAPSLAERVNRALHEAKLDDLHAAQQGGTAVVAGMVRNSADDVAARSVFLHLGPDHIARHYDVAQADIAGIEDSLGIDGLTVGYRGGGVFSIGGVVPSLTAFKEALNRLCADLDGNVRRLDVDVTEAANAAPLLVYSEMVAAGDTRYFETQDGVKHVFPALASELGSGVRALRESITPLHAQVQPLNAQ